MADRFIVKSRETAGLGTEERIVLVDRETGVNYLWYKRGYGGGLTPLLNRDGKPIITSVVTKREL